MEGGNATKLVVALKVSLDDSCTCYYPYPLVEKKERYIGTRLSLKKGMHGGGAGTKELKFGSLEYLKNTSTW